MRARLDVTVAPLHPDLHAALLAQWAVGAWDGPPHPLVVPAPALGRALGRDAARAHGAGFGIGVRTWTDLAAELTAGEREGRRRLRVEAATWLVRELRQRVGRAATTLDAGLEIPGVRAALRRTFDDLGRAGLASRRDVERVLLAHGVDLPLPLRHLLELLHAYRNSFEGTHDDRALLLARAAAIPAGRCAAVLGTTQLWIYGFDALDAGEARLFDRLCADPELELRVFVPRDGDADPPLAARAAARDGAVLRRVPARRRHGPDDLRLVATPSAEAEADEIARAVLRAAGDGMRFESMAVVAARAARLDAVAAALRRAGVPHVVHPGPALATTRTGRALGLCLDVAAAGLRPEPVLAFLAMAPLRWAEWAGIAADPVPSAWERVAREARLEVGREDWRFKLERLADERDALAARLEQESEPGVRARAAASAARELLQVATALDALVRRLPARAAWSDWVDAVSALLTTAFVPGPERDGVTMALERLRALDGLGRTLPARADFRDALRDVFADTALRSTVEPVAAVQLGTAAALWGATFDLVCLVGVEAGEWPPPRRDDAVLPAHRRDALAAFLPDPLSLPSPATRVERAERQFWDWCDAARRRLVIAWARLDPTTGAAILPSTLLLELAAARSGRDVDYARLGRLPFVERVPLRRAGLDLGVPALHRAELETWIASALPPAAARRWVAGLDLPAARGVALERLRAGSRRFTSADGLLSDGAARAALASRLHGVSLSATQLTAYATCPFRWFWRYLLRVEPLERDERRDLNDLESGRLAHQVLERLHAEAAQHGTAVADLDDAGLDAALDAALAAVCDVARARSTSRLLWDVRRRRLRDDLGRFLRREQAAAGPWRPRTLEERFGRGARLAPFVAGPDGERVRLHGVIDRIDARPDSDAVCVVDYKTGRALAAHKREPRAAQLAIYLYAATAGDPERLRRSEARFAHVTRRGDFAVQRLRGEAIPPDALAQLVRGVVGGIGRGELFAQPGPGATHCRGCDYEGACELRVAGLTARKEEAGQTAAFATLPDFALGLEHDAPAAEDDA